VEPAISVLSVCDEEKVLSPAILDMLIQEVLVQRAVYFNG